MGTSLRKMQEELENTEQKYHEATIEACDKMERLEKERGKETNKFINLYAQSILILTDRTVTLSKELSNLRIIPEEDILSVIKQYNVKVPQTEILLYDIYAEDERNVMSQERRLNSLSHWLQMLSDDLENQQKSKDASFFKIQSVYNRLTGAHEPYFRDAASLTETYTKDGCPTTMLRISHESVTEQPSAPVELKSRNPFPSKQFSATIPQYPQNVHPSAPPCIGFVDAQLASAYSQNPDHHDKLYPVIAYSE
ncbi:unnamed protein product [Didymodactylos carnosus]|uniref:Uncharacterized protein n=2 Tax=Didymodactylos carnosus TaxID=1234261 RepID=A0A8S2Q1R6_9BILA|nr:unnamed protein product [Didymodactylos carnosus]CAF4077759.1 unnamed protein product [Didymodactylos carnosus]